MSKAKSTFVYTRGQVHTDFPRLDMDESTITPLNIIQRIFSNWKALEEIVLAGKVDDNEMMDKVLSFCRSFAIIVSAEDNLDYNEICKDLLDLTKLIFNRSLTGGSEKEIAKQIIAFHECSLKNDTEILKKEYHKLPALRKWIIS